MIFGASGRVMVNIVSGWNTSCAVVQLHGIIRYLATYLFSAPQNLDVAALSGCNHLEIIAALPNS